MALRRGGGGRDATPGPAGKDDQSTGRFGGKAEDHTPDRYKMREKLLSIGDDFWIETMKGRRAYKVDGKALRLRNTLVLEDPGATRSMKSRPRSWPSKIRWPSPSRTAAMWPSSSTR